MSAEFVHLHLHTEYSLVDSVLRIKKAMPVVAQSMAAVALTDQSSMMGGVKFYRAALGAGLKPILGVDAWIGETATDDNPHKLVMLAQNAEGYKNLSELISLGYQKGQYRDRAIIQREWLNSSSTKGLIALSAARRGDIGAALVGGAEDTAEEYLSRWRSLFGDRFYLEVQRTGRENEELYIDGAVRLASATGTPLVATNDVVLTSKDQFESHEARVCINQGRVLADPNRPRDYTDQQYLRSADEMAALFADIPSAIENSVEIAKRCSVKISLGTPVLPDFPIPEGMTEAEYFCEVSYKGLAQRLIEDFPDEQKREGVRARYEERLQVELDVINGMGFPGYFLIVADFIQWSKDNDIPVGPGRGSGAGSLVAYALLITDLDPLPYDLLFERFLNPERVSMPDFDIDFCIEGRDRVIRYVADKYGHEKVSQIITYGTLAAKAVVRDCGRVLGHPYGMVDGISKLVPFEVGMTLSKALEVEPELQRRYNEDEEVHYLLDLGLSLEGIARNAGKHAGGVVIAPTGLTDFCPLYCEPDGSSLVTQFDKDDAEAVGLVKFDFLGLRTLTIIDYALKVINADRDEPLKMADVALDDQPTFDLLQRADTTAVFQLESRGMKDLISRLKPDNFEDIVALVALFRPGPLSSGMVDDFIARKHGKDPISYPHIDYQHQSLKPVLEPTYGIILYQEQVMQIAQVLAGYTLGGADMLRRAMGKKKPEEMAKQKAGFVEGSVKNGIDADLSEKIFDLVEKFAGYGFNKSHSAAYALVSYHTAWLKCHYPAEFMSAVMTLDMDNTEKLVISIRDCLAMGMTMLQPDINLSGLNFLVEEPRTIRFGLGGIKGVGGSALVGLFEERDKNGPFKSLADLCKRAELNKRVLESLIKSGALDSIGPNRASLMLNLTPAVKAAEQHSKNQKSGMMDLFGDSGGDEEEAAPVHYDIVPEGKEKQKLLDEKSTLGLYLTGHPINEFVHEIKNFTQGRIGDQCANVQPSKEQKYMKAVPTVMAGLVTGIRVINGQRGKRVLVGVDDNTGTVEATLDGDLFDSNQHLIKTDEVLVVEGDLSFDDFTGGHRLKVRQLYDMDTARARHVKRLEITLTAGHDKIAQSLDSFAKVLKANSAGRTPVVINYRNQNAEAKITLGNNWKIRPMDSLKEELQAVADVTVEFRY